MVVGKGAPFNIGGSSTAMSYAMGISEEEVRQMVVADFMPAGSPGTPPFPSPPPCLSSSFAGVHRCLRQPAPVSTGLAHTA